MFSSFGRNHNWVPINLLRNQNVFPNFLASCSIKLLITLSVTGIANLPSPNARKMKVVSFAFGIQIYLEQVFNSFMISLTPKAKYSSSFRFYQSFGCFSFTPQCCLLIAQLAIKWIQKYICLNFAFIYIYMCVYVCVCAYVYINIDNDKYIINMQILFRYILYIFLLFNSHSLGPKHRCYVHFPNSHLKNSRFVVHIQAHPIKMDNMKWLQTH